MKDTDKNIITKAVTRFEDETGFRLTTYITDEKVELILREKEYDLKFTAEVIPFLNKNNLGIIKNRLVEISNCMRCRRSSQTNLYSIKMI